MINLTGVCLIRHHIKAWEQVQATLIDLDKFCDRIVIFSFNQAFRAELDELAHSKITTKYLPLSATDEAIKKYIVNCLQFVSTKGVFYLEAGECIHQNFTSEFYIDLLQMLEEEKADGIEFPIRFHKNRSQIVYDSTLPLRQVRAMKKSKIQILDDDFGLLSNLKAKEVKIVKSQIPILSFGSRENKLSTQTSSSGSPAPIQIEEWLSRQETDLIPSRPFSALNVFRHLKLFTSRFGIPRLTKRRYSYFKEDKF